MHLEHQLGDADRVFGLEDRGFQVAELHLRRQQIVFRGQAVLVLHLRIVDRTLYGGLRLAEHVERLLGKQDVVEGLFDFGRQRDARRTRRFDGRGHLLVVHLHHAVNLRREERHRSIHGPAERRIGVVAQREALGHLLHDEAVVDLPGHRHLRQQAAPCLAFHIVVALHLHLGDLDGR